MFSSRQTFVFYFVLQTGSGFLPVLVFCVNSQMTYVCVK